MRQFNHTAPSGAHFSLTFFTGVALGVALGMLFAPSEGRQLRSQLTDRAQRLGAQDGRHLQRRGRDDGRMGRTRPIGNNRGSRGVPPHASQRRGEADA